MIATFCVVVPGLGEKSPQLTSADEALALGALVDLGSFGVPQRHSIGKMFGSATAGASTRPPAGISIRSSAFVS